MQVFHSDYFSGWDEKELQYVLDNCENESEAANPDAFCSDFLTFRGKPKEEGVQVEDFDIRDDLEKIQPDPINVKATISAEDVSDIPELQRGACTGTLITSDSTTTAPPPTTTTTTPTTPTTTTITGLDLGKKSKFQGCQVQNISLGHVQYTQVYL